MPIASLGPIPPSNRKTNQARDDATWRSLQGMNHSELFEVIHEDKGLLVVHKPADLVCHPTKGDVYSSLISRARLHCKGEAEALHMVNRLDRETSGLVFIAKDRETARELTRQWEHRSVEKTYRAIVHGWPTNDEFKVHAALGKDTQSQVAIKDRVCANGHPATTSFRVLKRFERDGDPFALLEVSPLTGRKHQIRIHLQHVGHPIVGDKIYGLDERYYLALVNGVLSDSDRQTLRLPCQALHAQSVTFDYHGQRRRFETEPEPWFEAFHQSCQHVTDTCQTRRIQNGEA